MSSPSQEVRVVDAAIARCRAMVGPLLPVLNEVQSELGYIPEHAIPRIAAALNLSRAEVHGVVSFYHDYRTRPPGRRVVKVCRAEACQAMGGDALAAHVEARLGCAIGETRDDEVTVDAAYCFGNCACAPAVMIDGALHGRVTPARFDELVGAPAEEERS